MMNDHDQSFFSSTVCLSNCCQSAAAVEVVLNHVQYALVAYMPPGLRTTACQRQCRLDVVVRMAALTHEYVKQFVSEV